MICASNIISVIGLLVALAASLPLSEREELTEWAPTITYPDSAAIWCAGATHHVYWDTSNPPDQITNLKGYIYLVIDSRVDLSNPLAKDFYLTDGHATIIVPNVSPGQYAVDLYGDSGNWSPTFQINNC